MTSLTSSNVTSSESHNELFALGAFGPGFGDEVGVNSLNGPLEAGELHHGIGNLTTPKRYQRLVEAIHALGGVDLGEGSPQSGWEGAHVASLNPDLA